MKKYKKLIFIISIVLGLALTNFAYYLFIKSQTYFKAKTSSSLVGKKVGVEKYSNVKIGFEVEYPASWIVKEDDNIVEINPLDGKSTYFSVGLRNEFKSLEEIKQKLAPNMELAPVKVGDASGFKYRDTDFREVIWLLQSGKIYVLRIYPVSQEADKILASFKFNN